MNNALILHDDIIVTDEIVFQGSICQSSTNPTKSEFVNAFIGFKEWDKFGIFPLGHSTPYYRNLKFPDMEKESRITLLHQQYHGWILYNILKIIEESKLLPPIQSEITIFLDFKIDFFQFYDLSNPSYATQLKSSINSDFRTQQLHTMMPAVFAMYNGKYGNTFPIFKTQNLWSYCHNFLHEKMLGIIDECIPKLLTIAEKNLKEKGNPIPQPPYIPALVEDVKPTLESVLFSGLTRYEKKEKLKTTTVVGKELEDGILGGKIRQNFEFYDRIFERYTEAAYNYAIGDARKTQGKTINALMWYFILGELTFMLTLVPFFEYTFCKFLKTIVNVNIDELRTS